MFKKYLKIVFLFIMINLISCGGGGGGGHDYSGTWNVQGTLVRNGCPTNPQQGENYNIIVNQDGDDIVIFDGNPLEVATRTMCTLIDGEIIYADDTFKCPLPAMKKRL